jgi:[acyl-carrier-protein] S-malonyltransferase
MAKIAILFPGQGAQYVGMGREFYDNFPAARAVFDRAAMILGDSFLHTIFYGPEEDLAQTENTQPAVLATSIAVYRVLEELGCRALAVAGLSLGEYSALVAAGTLEFDQALPLVQKRGRFMQEAVPFGEGTMAAVMGLTNEKIEAVCRAASASGVVSPANYNCPGQVVISGRTEAVRLALNLAREAGAKKIVELKVSAPFHCSLLEPVEQQLARELEAITLSPPAVDVVFNVSADYETEPSRIKEHLIKQVSCPILWEQSIRRLCADGFDTFIDTGPGKSLPKLLKRIDPSAYTAAVDDLSSLEAVRDHLKGVAE